MDSQPLGFHPGHVGNNIPDFVGSLLTFPVYKTGECSVGVTAGLGCNFSFQHGTAITHQTAQFLEIVANDHIGFLIGDISQILVNVDDKIGQVVKITGIPGQEVTPHPLIRFTEPERNMPGFNDSRVFTISGQGVHDALLNVVIGYAAHDGEQEQGHQVSGSDSDSNGYSHHHSP